MRIVRSMLPIALSAVVGIVVMGCPAPQKKAAAQQPNPTSGANGAKATPSSGMRLPADKVVATWKDGKMTYGELMEKRSSAFSKMRKKHIRELYELERQEIEATIIQGMVQAAAQAKGQTEQEYLGNIAASAQVSETEMRAFYEARVKASGRSFEEVKEQIRGFLGESKQREAIQKEIERIRTSAGLKIELPAPPEALASFELAGRPMKGKPDAKVTVIEFSDFECPYCSKAVPQVEAILKAYPNDVKVYFLHFPLSFHKAAMPAAVATQCANQQGKFWELHDKLFESQEMLQPDKITESAKALGLDMTKFTTCLKDPKTAEFVKADMKQGEEAGVGGTPSFFINGVQFQGVPGPEAIKPHLAGS